MVCIIDRKRYSTDNAEEIAYWDKGLSDRDFNSLSETLYRTKKGAFFLVGDGGPMTWCAHACGDGSETGGKRLVPYTDNEAYAWCEMHGKLGAIEKYFSTMVIDA